MKKSLKKNKFPHKVRIWREKDQNSQKSQNSKGKSELAKKSELP